MSNISFYQVHVKSWWLMIKVAEERDREAEKISPCWRDLAWSHDMHRSPIFPTRLSTSGLMLHYPFLSILCNLYNLTSSITRKLPFQKWTVWTQKAYYYKVKAKLLSGITGEKPFCVTRLQQLTTSPQGWESYRFFLTWCGEFSDFSRKSMTW